MIDDFIHYISNALTLNQCKSLINFYESNKEYHKDGNVGDGNVNLDNKKCKEIFVNSELLNPQDPHFSFLGGTLFDNVSQYKKDYPFLERVFFWTIAPTFKIQKYLPDEAYFNIHCENDGNGDGSSEKRLLSWMIYLNDVTDGGETVFPTQCKKFAPRGGDVLIWPAYWTHPHHGLPSPSQIKYIVSGWFRYNND